MLSPVRSTHLLNAAAALLSGGAEELEALRAEVAACRAELDENAAYTRHADIARRKYADPSGDDIEIDDHPGFSPADGGVWVSAWVFVSDADTE